MAQIRRKLGVGLLALASAGCNPFGPSCLEQREEGTLPPVSGTVDADEMSVHVIVYDTRGSQNDVQLSWPGQGRPDSPQVRAYATRASCQNFTLPATSTTLIVTHGRGNPERLGSPPEFKLWIVSDRFTGYTFTIRWFYGPDC